MLAQLFCSLFPTAFWGSKIFCLSIHPRVVDQRRLRRDAEEEVGVGGEVSDGNKFASFFAMAGSRGAMRLLRSLRVLSAGTGSPAAGFRDRSCALHTQRVYGRSKLISGVFPTARATLLPRTWNVGRSIHADQSALPELQDPQAKRALNALLATNWGKIEKEIKDEVESVIAKGGGDASILSTVYSSAQASESFADTLISLRMELDDMSGADGGSVQRLPDTLLRALDSALDKYATYLSEMSEDEEYLKKKVENDIGALLVQIKQRCTGMDPRWSKITLLGTSGLSGSYIELRHEA